jgi:hypothetical protein
MNVPQCYVVHTFPVLLFIYLFKGLPGQIKVGNTVLDFKTAVPYGTIIMKSETTSCYHLRRLKYK